MKMTREEMLAAMGSRDHSLNGKFIIGVLSTGIYCLPSCHARVPKSENVRFFATGAEAAAVGLRPCKKCKPDEFESGEDRELIRLEELVSSVRQSPQQFTNASDLAKTLDVGTTKLHDLIRRHYHSTPSEVLTRAKLNRAKQALLETNQGIAEVAYDVGYESLSSFNETFKRRLGVSPSEYRKLLVKSDFHVHVPTSFHVKTLLGYLGRDPLSPTERVLGNRVWLTTPKGSIAEIELGESASVQTLKGESIDVFEGIHRIFGLQQDPKLFEQLIHELGFERLIAERSGTRIPQTASFVDGLVWSIVGQQINLPFAYRLRQRLFQTYGEPLGDGFYSSPHLDRLASLEPKELLPLQFSQRKAEYIIGVAKLGHKWLSMAEEMSATRLKKVLLEIRGFGAWSTNYVMMRAAGFADCLPIGDTGLTAGLIKFFQLESKPTTAEVEALMKPFTPYRSFATYHLWQSLK